MKPFLKYILKMMPGFELTIEKQFIKKFEQFALLAWQKSKNRFLNYFFQSLVVVTTHDKKREMKNTVGT